MKLLIEDASDIQFLSEERNGKSIKFFEGVFMQCETVNANKRIYRRDIMEAEMNRYIVERVNANRAWGELGHPNCFWSSTKALTTTGWKEIKDIVVGESVYSIHPSTGQLEIKKVTNVIAQQYNGKLYHFKNRTLNTAVTPNHRFLVQTRAGLKFITAQEIKDNFQKLDGSCGTRTWKLPKVASFGIDRNITTITIPGVLSHKNKLYEQPIEVDLYHFAGFLGFWLAEGHANKQQYNKCSVGLSQRKQQNFDQIRELVQNIPFEFTEYQYKTNQWICRDPRLWQFLNPLGKSYEKYVPVEILNILNEDQANYLLDMFILGDGTHSFFNNKKSTTRGFSTSKQLVEDLTIVCLLAGKAFRLWNEYPKNKENVVIEGYKVKPEVLRPIYALSVLQSSGVYFDPTHLSIQEIEWNDPVYCLEVEDNGTFYAMDNGYGFWTGNSPTINHERVSHRIISLRMEGNDVIGKAIITETPMGLIARGLLESGGEFGVSSRALGSTKLVEGVNVVQKDFKLSTAADIVDDASAPGAKTVRALMENKEWFINEFGQWASRQELIENTVKYAKKLSKSQLEEQKIVIASNFFKQLIRDV